MLKIKYLLLIFILVMILIEVNIIIFGLQNKPRKSDCIIILGFRVYDTNPSHFLQKRLMEGIKRLKKKYNCRR